MAEIPQSALIFIPDISGFTNFVKGTEIAHSRHIIEELLEAIIDANKVGLKVSEIEGDAILFYKETDNEEPINIVDQIREMYNSFHTHLKKYEYQRICQCGACSTAHSLRLKFVVNHGEITFNKIKDHVKLFGTNVIKAHRLLKNDIDSDEYVLFTQEAYEKISQNQLNDLGSISKARISSMIYDIGEVSYTFYDLYSLLAEVPDPTIEEYGLKGKKQLLDASSHTINVPRDVLFNVLSDYSLRHLWSDVIKDSVDLNGSIAKSGSEHRCLINDDSNDPFLKAHDFEITDEKIVFHETDEKKGYSIVYQLESLGGDQTRITATNIVSGGYLKGLIAKLLLKNRISRSKNEVFEKLESYCQKLLADNQISAHQIVLKSN